MVIGVLDTFHRGGGAKMLPEYIMENVKNDRIYSKITQLLMLSYPNMTHSQTVSYAYEYGAPSGHS